MKNVTITLDERTAAWARVQAAQRGISLSRMVGELLQERMSHDREYEKAMHRWLAKEPVKLGKPGEPYPSRDELHERPRLR